MDPSELFTDQLNEFFQKFKPTNDIVTKFRCPIENKFYIFEGEKDLNQYLNENEKKLVDFKQNEDLELLYAYLRYFVVLGLK